MATYTETHDRAGFVESRTERAAAWDRSGWRRAAAEIDPKRLARGLGWFSIGLGLAELIAPRAIARLTGTRNHSGLLRSYGLREIAAGAGILTSSEPGPWLWARVAGDALDLASLGSALTDSRNSAGLTLFGIASAAGVTALDVLCAQRLTEKTTSSGRAESSIIINRPPEEVYGFWRHLENLPRFMMHLDQVRTMDDRRSHWVVRTPGKATIEWDAEITEDRPNERISWRSLPRSDVRNSGSVEFEEAPGGRGTIVRVQMDFGNPAHALAASAAALMGKHPEQILNKDLRRCKQLIETGEIITTEGQPAGRRSGSTWLDYVAR